MEQALEKNIRSGICGPKFTALFTDSDSLLVSGKPLGISVEINLGKSESDDQMATACG